MHDAFKVRNITDNTVRKKSIDSGEESNKNEEIKRSTAVRSRSAETTRNVPKKKKKKKTRTLTLGCRR